MFKVNVNLAVFEGENCSIVHAEQFQTVADAESYANLMDCDSIWSGNELNIFFYADELLSLKIIDRSDGKQLIRPLFATTEERIDNMLSDWETENKNKIYAIHADFIDNCQLLAQIDFDEKPSERDREDIMYYINMSNK